MPLKGFFCIAIMGYYVEWITDTHSRRRRFQLILRNDIGNQRDFVSKIGAIR